MHKDRTSLPPILMAFVCLPLSGEIKEDGGVLHLDLTHA